MSTPKSEAARVVGERIRKAREAVGLSGRQAAQLADVDLTNYQRLERGEANPTLVTLVRVSYALGVDAGALVEGLGLEHLPDDVQASLASHAEFAEWLASRRA